MFKSLKMCSLYPFLGPYGLERDMHDFATFSLDRASRVLVVGHLRFGEDCRADFKRRPVLQNLVTHSLSWMLVKGLPLASEQCSRDPREAARVRNHDVCFVSNISEVHRLRLFAARCRSAGNIEKRFVVQRSRRPALFVRIGYPE